MLAVVTDRAGAVAFNFCGAIIRPPDDADVLPVRFLMAASDGGIELYKQRPFVGDREIKHHASFKIAAPAFIKSVAAFVAHIGAEQFFLFIH